LLDRLNGPAVETHRLTGKLKLGTTLPPMSFLNLSS
jgi:hypothetical protein